MKKLKVCQIISLIFGIISLCYLALNFIGLNYLRIRIINFEELGGIATWFIPHIWLGHIVYIVFHISAILTIFLQLKYIRKFNLLRALCFVLVIISLFLIFSAAVLLQDIAKEYMSDIAKIKDLGRESMSVATTQEEFSMLFFNYIVNILFHILMLLLLIASIIFSRNKFESEKIIKDESVFITAQYVGIFCGLIGLAIFLLFILQLPMGVIKGISILFSIIISIPYFIIALYWLFIKLKEKINEWYDEKQFKDIGRSSLITLIISLPVMGIMFFIPYGNPKSPIQFIWFPIYLFMVLLMFSGFTIYFNKRA